MLLEMKVPSPGESISEVEIGWASLAIGVSISLPAVMIRSANSSITNTIYGKYLCPLFGFNFLDINFVLHQTCLFDEN